MNYEEFEAIMAADFDFHYNQKGCCAIDGILIMRKYIPTAGIVAEHDQIWSVGVQELVNAGITEEDVIALRDLNWMIDVEAMSKFV